MHFPFQCSKWRRNWNQELDLINRWEYLAYLNPRGVFCNEGYLDCRLFCCFMSRTRRCFTARGGGTRRDRRRGGGRSGPVTGVSPLQSLSSQVCTLSRDTRGSLSASSLGCLQHNPLSHLMNLVPFYIIITLDNTPSFLVWTPFLVSFLCFDQNNSPADKITSEIETVNPGKTLVHFTLSPEHGAVTEPVCTHHIIRPFIGQGISALDSDLLFICSYQYLKQWLDATDGCPPLLWWQADQWFAIVLLFQRTRRIDMVWDIVTNRWVGGCM